MRIHPWTPQENQEHPRLDGVWYSGPIGILVPLVTWSSSATNSSYFLLSWLRVWRLLVVLALECIRSKLLLGSVMMKRTHLQHRMYVSSFSPAFILTSCVLFNNNYCILGQSKYDCNSHAYDHFTCIRNSKALADSHDRMYWLNKLSATWRDCPTQGTFTIPPSLAWSVDIKGWSKY